MHFAREQFIHDLPYPAGIPFKAARSGGAMSAFKLSSASSSQRDRYAKSEIEYKSGYHVVTGLEIRAETR